MLWLVLVPAAQADTLYAAYNGSGTTCSQASPCAAAAAVDKAVDGDTVILLYSPGNNFQICSSCFGLRVDQAITLRGEPDKPRPTIEASASGRWKAAVQVLAPGAVVEGIRVEASDRPALAVSATGEVAGAPPPDPVDGAVVRDVELEAKDPGSIAGVMIDGESTLERAKVLRTGTSDYDALWLANGALVRDSFILRNLEGTGSAMRIFGSDGGEVKLRNLTVGATGDGIFALGGPYDVSVRNTMINAGIDDVAATGTSIHVEVTNSNLNPSKIRDNPPDAVVELVPPNQDQTVAPPLLAAPAAFDYHELPGSPTIDAGSPDAFTGSTDIDGEPRLMGDGIDIGADEAPDLEPPDTTIDSGPPEGSMVATRTVTFTFSSAAADLAGFECSLDRGAFFPCSSPYTATGLSDGGHDFQVRAIDTAGNVDPTPAERPFLVGPPPKPPGDASVTIRLKSKRLKLRGRRAALRLACPSSETSPPCAGSLVLKSAAKLKLRGRRRPLTLAKAKFSIAAGKAKKVSLRFSAGKLKRLLRGRTSARMIATIRVRDRAGNRARVTKRLKLIRRSGRASRR